MILFMLLIWPQELILSLCFIIKKTNNLLLDSDTGQRHRERNKKHINNHWYPPPPG